MPTKVKGKRILKNGVTAGYVKQKDGSWRFRFLKGAAKKESKRINPRNNRRRRKNGRKEDHNNIKERNQQRKFQEIRNQQRKLQEIRNQQRKLQEIRERKLLEIRKRKCKLYLKYLRHFFGNNNEDLRNIETEEKLKRAIKILTAYRNLKFWIDGRFTDEIDDLIIPKIKNLYHLLYAGNGYKPTKEYNGKTEQLVAQEIFKQFIPSIRAYIREHENNNNNNVGNVDMQEVENMMGEDRDYF
jgi:hypothetical protein